jgi:hypothetical protein
MRLPAKHSFRRGSRPYGVHHYLKIDGRLTGGIRRLKRMDKRKGLLCLARPVNRVGQPFALLPATSKPLYEWYHGQPQIGNTQHCAFFHKVCRGQRILRRGGSWQRLSRSFLGLRGLWLEECEAFDGFAYVLCSLLRALPSRCGRYATRIPIAPNPRRNQLGQVWLLRCWRTTRLPSAWA